MKNKFIINYLILLLIFFNYSDCWSNNSQKNIIKQIIANSKSGNLNINIISSKKSNYKIFTLDNPDRLVLDFKDAKLDKKIFHPKFSSLSSFRSATKDSGIRIVFELNAKVKIIDFASKLNQNHYIDINLLIEDQNNKKYSLKNLDNLIEKTAFKENKKIITKKSTIYKKPVKKKKIIVIDAGHGGKDPGAIGGYYKTQEKKVTLAFAKEIKDYMKKYSDFKVYLTRDTDHFISLDGRVKKSQKLNADLFISIHADSAKNRKASGLSIYTLSENSSDKEAAKLAEKENKSDIIGGVNFSSTSKDILKILIDLSQRSVMNDSAKFAEFTIKNLAKKGIKVKQNTHRFAGFRVLTAPDVPSILIELGYLSNKNDERNLNSSSYRKKFAKEITNIIKGYF